MFSLHCITGRIFCYNTAMNTTPFASRAGEKLQHAITTFSIDVSQKSCADFGSSVGGFVDCLLQNHAEKVYAVETGYGELAWKLRTNPKVIVLERTNAMHITLPEKVDIITTDTSWTKIKNIHPNAIRNLKKGGILISLIKPHYEADRTLLKKGVLDSSIAETLAKEVAKESEAFGITLQGITISPLLGGKGGNTEFLAFYTYP